MTALLRGDPRQSRPAGSIHRLAAEKVSPLPHQMNTFLYFLDAPGTWLVLFVSCSRWPMTMAPDLEDQGSHPRQRLRAGLLKNEDRSGGYIAARISPRRGSAGGTVRLWREVRPRCAAGTRLGQAQRDVAAFRTQNSPAYFAP